MELFFEKDRGKLLIMPLAHPTNLEGKPKGKTEPVGKAR
jgi:hypothetical protein